MAAAPTMIPTQPRRSPSRRAAVYGSYPPASARAASLWDLRIPHKGRALAVGMTESGKSTLSERQITMWLQEHGEKARVLILDSKPRFRAQWRLDGYPASYLYKKWAKDHGSQIFPESVLLDLNHPAASLRRIWNHGVPVPQGAQTRVAIAQGTLASLDWLTYAAKAAFDMAKAGWETLIYVDELADFFGSSGIARRGDPILQIIRAGREKHVAFAAGSQRPKGIPKSALTEMTAAYVFNLSYQDDLKHLQEIGFPDEIDYWRLMRNKHSFYYFNRQRPEIRGYYRWDRG